MDRRIPAWRAVVLITIKDLRLRVRDRSAFVIGIVAPFGLAFILNMVVGGAFEQVGADVAVVDHDEGNLGESLVEALGSVPEVDVTTGLDEDDARAEVDDGDLQAVIVIPAGFSDAVEATDTGAELQVVGNVDEEIPTQIALAVAEGFADRVNAVRLSVTTALSGEVPETMDVDALVDQASEQSPPVGVEMDPRPERQLETKTYLIAGMSVLFLFFLVQFGVRGLLEERDQGTMPRLLAAPVPRGVVPLAKAMVSVALGLFALAVLVVASTVVLGADWGDPLVVLVLSVAVVLAAMSIMGIVVAVARNAEQADNAQTVIAMVLGVLGGSFFPLSQGEGIVARLPVFTPHHWFLTGLGEGQAGGVGDVLVPLAALLAFATVVGGIGALLVVRRAGRGWAA